MILQLEHRIIIHTKSHSSRFHYDVIKKKYGQRAQLLFTDTDSLMYEIATDDVYEDMWAMKEHFDLAEYPKTSCFYDPQNNKVVGKMKDEVKGQPILEFVGLRPKMYSFLVATVKDEGDIEVSCKHRCKGIARAAAELLKHEDYKRQLDTPVENYVVNRRLGSELHQLYGIAVRLPPPTEIAILNLLNTNEIEQHYIP